jgi:hypothetical protein
MTYAGSRDTDYARHSHDIESPVKVPCGSNTPGFFTGYGCSQATFMVESVVSTNNFGCLTRSE